MSGSLRVLLVEDNPGDADLIMELLPTVSSTLFHVKCVTRLSEALELIEAQRFDLALLDLGLPDSGGLATLRTLRRQAEKLPIIVLTGNDDEQTGLGAIREGAQDYLIKGQTDKNLLTRSIKYAVRRKQAENALKELNDTLEQRISARTAQIASTNETLRIEIGERKQVEEALRRTEKEWERTFTSVPDLIATLDSRHRVLRVNDAMARRLGLKPEECVGLHCYQVIHGTSAPPEFCPHSKTMEDGREHCEELHVDRLGGDFLVTTTPLLDETGKSIGSVHIARDITEKKRMEGALLKSEERYRILFETMTEGFALHEVISDDQGRPCDCRFLDMNPAFEQLTGLKRADLIGKRVSEVMPDIEFYWIENYGKVALTGEPLHMEHYSAALESWYQVFAYRTAPGHFAVVFSDITERKMADAALITLKDELESQVAERTEELAATIEELRVEIVDREKAEESLLRLNRLYLVLSETNHAIIRANDRDTLFDDFCRIAVEDGGFKLAWVGLVNEEGGALKAAASAGATSYLKDIKITVKDEPDGQGPTAISIREDRYYICNDFLGAGITAPWHARGLIHGIRASASIPLKQEGRVIGALTLYADEKDFFDIQQVGLLKQMGADVSFALDNIVRETRRLEAERALREETAERLRAVDALREKEQMLIQQNRHAAMGEMIGNIAHQWRQPLNNLGLLVQQTPLLYKFGEVDEEFLENNARKSMEYIQHMSRTIDDFRNFFKLDKKKVEFKVHEEVAKTLSLMEGSFQGQQVGIVISAELDPVILGYPNEFSQVLLNLLINARDALIAREVVKPKILITIGSEGNRAVVTVADNAGGIPEEIIDKIFDPYFTTKGPQAGTGVGLFMSKTIIEKNMGGLLSVRNVEGGAEFKIQV